MINDLEPSYEFSHRIHEQLSTSLAVWKHFQFQHQKAALELVHPFFLGDKAIPLICGINTFLQALAIIFLIQLPTWPSHDLLRPSPSHNFFFGLCSTSSSLTKTTPCQGEVLLTNPFSSPKEPPEVLISVLASSCARQVWVGSINPFDILFTPGFQMRRVVWTWESSEFQPRGSSIF